MCAVVISDMMGGMVEKMMIPAILA